MQRNTKESPDLPHVNVQEKSPINRMINFRISLWIISSESRRTSKK